MRLDYKHSCMKEKARRKPIYEKVEGIIQRPLTIEEHDELRTLLFAYRWGSSLICLWLKQQFCIHKWDVQGIILRGRMKFTGRCDLCDLHKW